MTQKQQDELSHMLLAATHELQLTLSIDTCQRLIEYICLLHKWNKAYNLTAIRDLKASLIRHIFDSLAVVPFIKGPQVLDFGTGAGLPGIPLALTLPELQFTLIDSSQKKTTFLRHVALTLGINNAKIITSRIETFRFSPGFATIITRATTSLKEIVSKVSSLCAPGGQILVMKGKHPQAELQMLPNKVAVHKLTVPFLAEERCLVEIAT